MMKHKNRKIFALLLFLNSVFLCGLVFPQNRSLPIQNFIGKPIVEVETILNGVKAKRLNTTTDNSKNEIRSYKLKDYNIGFTVVDGIVKNITVELRSKKYSPSDFGLPSDLLEKENVEFEFDVEGKTLVASVYCKNKHCVLYVDKKQKPEPPKLSETDLRIEAIISSAETFFLEGERHLGNRDKNLAREKFDKAIETILLSRLLVQPLPELHRYYNELIQRIYNLEFPAIKIASSDNTLFTAPKPSQSEQTQGGFIEQKFEPSPFDELAKLELEEKPKTDEVVVNKVASRVYVRPSLTKVTAIAGDTIEKVASRYGFNAVELARYNGLLPSSSLPAGREIRIPLKIDPATRLMLIKPIVVETSENAILLKLKPVVVKTSENAILGDKPVQSANGKVQIVMNWFQEYLHDPYSMKIVRWSKPEKENFAGEPYWVVRVRLRAKNSFGAYILNDYTFFIRRNKIVHYLN